MKVYDNETLKLIVESALEMQGCKVESELESFEQGEIRLVHTIDVPLAPVNLVIKSCVDTTSTDNYYIVGEDFIDTLEELKEAVKNLFDEAIHYCF